MPKLSADLIKSLTERNVSSSTSKRIFPVLNFSHDLKRISSKAGPIRPTYKYFNKGEEKPSGFLLR
jgi:hypothetical protein